MFNQCHCTGWSPGWLSDHIICMWLLRTDRQLRIVTDNKNSNNIASFCAPPPLSLVFCHWLMLTHKERPRPPGPVHHQPWSWAPGPGLRSCSQGVSASSLHRLLTHAQWSAVESSGLGNIAQTTCIHAFFQTKMAEEVSTLNDLQEELKAADEVYDNRILMLNCTLSTSHWIPLEYGWTVRGFSNTIDECQK